MERTDRLWSMWNVTMAVRKCLSHQNQHKDAREDRVPKWLSENLINSQAPEAKQSEVYTRKLKKCESRSRFSSASKTCHVWKKLLSTERIITYATSRAHLAAVDPCILLFLCLLVILSCKQHIPRVKNTTLRSNYLVLPLTSSKPPFPTWKWGQ